MAEKPGRREVLRKAAYLAPLVMTLPVLPSFASAGSGSPGGDGGGEPDGGGRRRRRRGQKLRPRSRWD